MHNEEPRVAAAAPDADDPAGLHLLYDQEMLQLNATIAELLGSVHALAQEKNRAQGLSDIILQLREANEHLVLATFGARDLQARAEATTLRQYEFLSMLAHELRNPLQPMAMANNLLKELVGLHPNLARVYGVNQRQISHMARLIDDLFDASRISQGRITLQSAPLLLHDIISVAVETSQPAMTLRNQQLHLYLPAAPLSIHGDMVRLCQLFSNLLLNASKFTHEYGHITIRARQVQDRVEVSVSDDGAGIAA